MIQTTPAARALDRLARLERLYDGPVPAPLRRWALGVAPSAPPRLQADPGAPARRGPPAADASTPEPDDIESSDIESGELKKEHCLPAPGAAAAAAMRDSGAAVTN